METQASTVHETTATLLTDLSLFDRAQVETRLSVEDVVVAKDRWKFTRRSLRALQDVIFMEAAQCEDAGARTGNLPTYNLRLSLDVARVDPRAAASGRTGKQMNVICISLF